MVQFSTLRQAIHVAGMMFKVEVGQYIENIVDISPISIYRYRYRIGT